MTNARAVPRSRGGARVLRRLSVGVRRRHPVVNQPSLDGRPAGQHRAVRPRGKDLKHHGFTFVGSTIVYSFLQSVGVVDDHLVTCPCQAARSRARARSAPMRLGTGSCEELLRRAERATLATLHPTRGVDAVPVCFSYADGRVAVPVDRVKAKSSTVLQTGTEPRCGSARRAALRPLGRRRLVPLVVGAGLARTGRRPRAEERSALESGCSEPSTASTRAGPLPTCWSSGSPGLIGWAATADGAPTVTVPSLAMTAVSSGHDPPPNARVDQAVQLVLGVVVVGRGPHHRRRVRGRHVQTGPGASLTETLMPAAEAPPRHLGRPWPGPVKVTMPDRRVPAVVDLDPVDGRPAAAQPLRARSVDSRGDGVDAQGQGMVDGHARAQVGGHREPRTRGIGPPRPAAGNGSASSHTAALPPMPGGRARSAKSRLRRRAARFPGARAATCDRWRWPRRSRFGPRRPEAVRRSGRRRESNGTPARRQTSPASSTGLTRPRWVPTWVTDTRATRSVERSDASASRSSVPSAVLGTTSMVRSGQLAHLE